MALTTITMREAQFLFAHALNTMPSPEDDHSEKCCASCCAPCGVVFNADRDWLNEIFQDNLHWSRNWDWWDDATDMLDWSYVEARVTPTCAVCAQ